MKIASNFTNVQWFQYIDHMSLIDEFENEDDGSGYRTEEVYRVVVTRSLDTGAVVREEWYDRDKDVLSRQEGPALIFRDEETGKKTQVFYFIDGVPWVPDGVKDFHLTGEDAEKAPEGKCIMSEGSELDRYRWVLHHPIP